MFDLNIRFQLAAVSVLFVILFDYLKNKHLKLLSNQLFICILVTTIFNLVMDMSTVYTITHINKVAPTMNRLCHQFFIFSIILDLFFVCMYVLVLGNNQKRLKIRRLFLYLIPLLTSIIFIIFGKLQYHVSEKAVYSYGLMAYTVYICAFVYLVLSFRGALNKANNLKLNQRTLVVAGLTIWVIVLIIQMFNPRLLLSGIGFVLLTLAIYFSFENPMENADVETGTFNKNAFYKNFEEHFENNKPLILINIVCENYERINALFGHAKAIESLKYTKDLIRRYFSEDIYRFHRNVYTIFLQTNDLSEQSYIAMNLNKLEYSLTHNEFSEAKIRYHIDVMDIKKFIASKDEAYELISYMADKNTSDEENVIYYLNEEVVNKKIRRDKIDQIITHALENDGFELYYQPIYWPSTGAFSSAEALLRFKESSELGYISPEEFIPIAEEKGLIMDIGDKVLELAASFIQKNNLQYSGLKYIEVNLSGMQIVAPDIVNRLKQIMDKYGIINSFINLEITETAIIDAGDGFKKNVARLKDDKFSFSMDDFGTGYSNLAQMNEISYDLVKIDKSLLWSAFGFQSDLNDEKKKKALTLLESVINMLKKFGAGIVVEGVETKEMAEYLIDTGVDHLQGYYYSRPVPEEKYLELLKRDKIV